MRLPISLFAAAIAVSGLGLAFAQPPGTPPTQPTYPPQAQVQPTPTQPLGTAPQQQEVTYRVRDILGARVNVAGDASVGVIEDLVFDADGQIEYAIVADQGRLVTVPWQAVRFAPTPAPAAGVVRAVPYVATVAIPVAEYRRIPTFTATTYPSFYAPTYRTEVYRYYGLTPRERRAVERRLR